MLKQIFVRIYLMLLVGMFVLLLVVSPIVRQLLSEDKVRGEKELIKGTFFLLSEKLEGLDETGVRVKLAELQPEFGFPVGMVRLSDIGKEKEYYREIEAGEIVRDQKADLHYFRLKQTGIILVTGPYFITNLGDRARHAVLVLVVLLVSLPAGVWAILLHRNLNKIERVASRFVAGDHSVRLHLVPVLPLKKISASFNHMAETTQGLISSQKELVNSIAHEIRTPLSRIKFSLEMLEEGRSGQAGNGEDPGFTGEIRTDIEEISGLVDEMLTYARFERERLPGETLSRVEMVSWLKETAYDEFHAGMAGNRLTLSVSADIASRRCCCEPAYLGRAVGNLVRNAARYGRRQILVSLEDRSGGVQIHVDDDGPGIAPDAREHLFEPFFRIDKSRGRDSGGYGLGLAIAKRIAWWHQGSISVSGSPLGGARFTLFLPDSE